MPTYYTHVQKAGKEINCNLMRTCECEKQMRFLWLDLYFWQIINLQHNLNIAFYKNRVDQSFHTRQRPFDRFKSFVFYTRKCTVAVPERKKENVGLVFKLVDIIGEGAHLQKCQ